MTALPSNVDCERFVLGSILLDDVAFAGAAGALTPDHFALEKHRRILRRMSDIFGREERVDRLTVANELLKHGELDLVDGLAYLCSLDENLPQIPNLDSYLRILEEKRSQRKILFACQNLTNRVELGDGSTEIVAAAQELFAGIGTAGSKALRVADLPAISSCGGGDLEYMVEPELPRGAVVAITGDSAAGKSTLVTAWARDVDVPVLFLDRENPLSVVRDRLDRLGWAQDDLRARWWGGWCDQEAPLPDSPAVMEWAASCEPKPLVVVDSYGAFQPGDQNDATVCRAFMHRCRRLADRGATVVVLHHDGKSETAKDYRGSSDFKASVDVAIHVSNFGDTGKLDRLVLRPFKTRVWAGGEIIYSYAGGRFIRQGSSDSAVAVNEQLTTVLRLNPGVTSGKFDELCVERGLSRSRARTFLADGVLSGAIRQESGRTKNAKRFYLAGMEAQNAL